MKKVSVAEIQHLMQQVIDREEKLKAKISYLESYIEALEFCHEHLTEVLNKAILEGFDITPPETEIN